MPIHFTPEEFEARRVAAIEAMVAEGLDGVLMFRQESMYYLTGYDTFGYVYFQCLYLGADGTLTLLTRPPDVHLARYTSVIEDVRVWIDGHGVDPALALRDVLEEHGCRGKRLGIEHEAYGLTGNNLLRVQGALDGFCALDDASRLVSRLRLVKSPSELAYVRRAAELADDASTTCTLIRQCIGISVYLNKRVFYSKCCIMFYCFTCVLSYCNAIIRNVKCCNESIICITCIRQRKCVRVYFDKRIVSSL